MGGRPEAFIPNTQRLRARPGSAAGRVRVRTVLCTTVLGMLADAAERLQRRRVEELRVVYTMFSDSLGVLSHMLARARHGCRVL